MENPINLSKLPRWKLSIKEMVHQLNLIYPPKIQKLSLSNVLAESQYGYMTEIFSEALKSKFQLYNTASVGA